MSSILSLFQICYLVCQIIIFYIYLSNIFTIGVGYERPISLWRTAYSSVTQSRKQYPDAVGAVAWIAQYAPHHSTFAPVYAAADKTPSSLNRGTQFKVDKKSNWWIHCITG